MINKTMDVPFKKKYNSDAQEVSFRIKLTSTHTWSPGENLILFYIFVVTKSVVDLTI